MLITEPDLDDLVLRAVRSDKLRAYNTPQPADIYIMAVPTPFKENKKPDLLYVEQATDSICQLLKANDLVILESTSPVGTTEAIAARLFAARPELRGAISIAYCPERVLPGKILRELVDNDRIVGGIDDTATRRAAEFYRSFVQGAVLETNSRTAELCKLTENSYRDVNIAFANELSIICDELNVDVRELIKLANRHPRVNILSPGPGVGGHCIAVDPWFIVDSAPQSARIIRMAREVNDSKPEYVADKIIRSCQGNEAPVVSCLGLAFKADVDDYRESPSIEVVEHLAKKQPHLRIIVTDPFTAEIPRALAGLPNVEFNSGFVEACKMATHIVILTDHSIYRKISRSLRENKVIIDTRGLFES